MKLEPFQQEIMLSLIDAIKAGHKTILLQLATAGGKTVIAASLIKAIVDKGYRGLFTASGEILIDQAYETIVGTDIDCGRIIAGVSDATVNLPQSMKVASIQTLVKRIKKWQLAGTYPWRPDYIFWDECHHNRANTWIEVAEYFRKINPDLIEIGLTATPARTDGKPLGDSFEVMVCGPSVRELTKLGRLCPFKLISPKTPLHKIRQEMRGKGGDFSTADQGRRIKGEVGKLLASNTIELYKNPLTWKKRTIFFGVDLEHSRNTAAAFNAAGIPARHIDGKTPRGVRKTIVEEFKRGEILVLCNYNLVSEGADFPQAVVLIFGRATQSLIVWLQACGRVLRKDPDNPNKLAIIIDQGWNYHTLGSPDKERKWSLEADLVDPYEEEGQAVGIPPCPECGERKERTRTPEGAFKCGICGHIWTRIVEFSEIKTEMDILADTSDLAEQLNDPFRIAKLRRQEYTSDELLIRQALLDE